MPDPHLSVIIAVFNHERYLGEAIRSVLDQDYDDLEIIVVDDGSTDGSAETAAGFEGVRVIRQQNTGHGGALNKGVANARGELISFLDADDLWEPGTLASRVSRFEDDPELQLSHGMLVEFVSPELASEGMTFRRADGKPKQGPVCGTVIIRRTAWDRIGPLDESLRLGSFIDWVNRAREAGLKTCVHNDVLLRRRIHDDNVTTRRLDSRSDYAKLAKRALDRKRRARDSGHDAPPG